MSSTNGKKIYPQILSEDGSLSTSKKSASGLIGFVTVMKMNQKFNRERCSLIITKIKSTWIAIQTVQTIRINNICSPVLQINHNAFSYLAATCKGVDEFFKRMSTSAPWSINIRVISTRFHRADRCSREKPWSSKSFISLTFLFSDR